jgi:glycosyltransferase involved in cell wall biosynthesis
VLVHSRFARERVLASRPGARVGVVPLAADLDAIRVPDAAERARARRAVGAQEEEPLLASFGFVTPQKHLGPALAAFARLRRERPGARFALVGEVSRHYDLDEVLDRCGREGVLVTGRVTPAALADWMAACDLAVNLRHPTGGETSATLVRLLALGRPVVVTDGGSFAELPDGVVAKVGTGPEEEEHLFELFRRLAGGPELAAALGRAARGHAERQHGLDAATAGYLEFVASTLAAGGRVVEAVPPLAPWRADDAWTGLVAGLGADLADLGLGEGDDEALGEIAERLVELELDRSPA